MIKAFSALLTLLLSSAVVAQNGSLLIKKRNKVVQRLWTGSEFAFQTAGGYWHKGKITRLTKDSLYIRPVIVRYHLMGTDTIVWPVEGYHYSDVAAIPKKGFLISFINNSFQINRDAGHVHWFWVKSGVIFRAGAAAYTGLMLVNNISDKAPDKKEITKGLLTGASVYLFGFILKKMYSPVHKTGKNYSLAYIDYAIPEPGTQ